ncbi:MAG: hypothetical protein M3503_02485 [Actinomycetota bacterium]|nr:hypothetical protein [Actinomycetota bacterium]
MGQLPLRRVLAVVVAAVLLTSLSSAAPVTAQTSPDQEDVLAYGDAGFHGSAGGTDLHRPLVGLAATPTGNGYWLAASDGGIFAFGDARFHGSTGNTRLNQPIVGMAATPTGNGYWLVASDGGIFALGDAGFHGSGTAPDRYRRFVGMAATPTGNGYWLVTSGECVFSGSTAERALRPDSHVVQQTDIRAGAHECFDRVVLSFDVEAGAGNATTSYEITYRSPPFAGPSGIPEDVSGGAFIEVVLFGARAHDLAGQRTYTGPDEIRPNLTAVRELQLVEDFEATLVWVVGVDRRLPFNVFQLDSPERLVIDVGHR